VAEAGASSVVSAQREPSSLPGAVAAGVAAYGRAVPRWAASAASHELAGAAEAVPAASDVRAQPPEAAVAEPGAEPEEAAAEPDAEPAAAEAEAAARDAALLPGVVVAAEAAVRDAVRRLVVAAAGRVAPELRPAAGPSAAAPSAFHRGQAHPWLAP
jgi:hypothetical protein